MIYIEKIKTPGVSDTLTDIFINGNREKWISNSIFLMPELSSQLDGISIGKLYGSAGIDIETAIGSTRKNIIYDVDIHNLHTLELILELIRTSPVMVSDLPDGGMGIWSTEKTTPLPTWLLVNKVIPKDLYYVSGSYNYRNNDIPQLNYKNIVVPIWLTTAIVQSNQHKIIQDANIRKEYLENITYKIPSAFAIFPNMKIRLDRLRLLSELHRSGVLSYIDWSAVSWEKYNNDHFGQHDEEMIEDFIRTHTFPKILAPIYDDFRETFTHIPDEYIKKYRWHINTETIFGVLINRRKQGEYGHVTEKTAKAFFCGAMPITLATTGYEPYLRELGFIVPETGAENFTDPIEKTLAIADYIEHVIENDIMPDQQEILHNAELITDKEFLCSLISGPLNAVFSKDK